jgi:hypothetical protein
VLFTACFVVALLIFDFFSRFQVAVWVLVRSGTQSLGHRYFCGRLSRIQYDFKELLVVRQVEQLALLSNLAF